MNISSIRSRLLKYVAIGSDDECWNWTGKAKTAFGYGRMTAGRGVHLKAHRAAWMAWVGPIPDGLCLLHRCDNPACCNPTHLSLGTKKDNTRDAMEKGRLVSPPLHIGSAHPRSILTEDSVRDIRASIESALSLAKRHKVTRKTIYEVRRRLSWAHVA